MKKITFPALIVISCFLFFCDKEPDENSIPSYVGSVLGGCNGQKSLTLKSAGNEKDTVIYFLKNDTLHIFTGLNYTCCAPFETSASFTGESINMDVKDKCSNLSLCYCKCICYYTFDFRFTGFENKKYSYKIMLTDPRQSGPVVFREGWIDLTKS